MFDDAFVFVGTDSEIQLDSCVCPVVRLLFCLALFVSGACGSTPPKITTNDLLYCVLWVLRGCWITADGHQEIFGALVCRVY